MDHTNHVRLTASELTPAVLEGATIYGADDQKVGKVDHIHGAGAGGSAVIDVGGFLGIGAKPVAVPISDLEFMRDEDVTFMPLRAGPRTSSSRCPNTATDAAIRCLPSCRSR
ncbi:PRC-barrel domain-containing protein [Rhizobium tibeticum]|uniref:PRC-barrel domain protein n=1 Tax=Rhizobium tibeticum TaxID=501024 RepID=A0A1H8WC57_9HYPH|nr:PRC-barrel domain protein [Rhizobium tibeticum]SEP25226.1 PRC-barrel domain-containing protein [Rhizobium tibeticum]